MVMTTRWLLSHDVRWATTQWGQAQLADWALWSVIGYYQRLASLWLVILVITLTVRHLADLVMVVGHAFWAVWFTSKASRICNHLCLSLRSVVIILIILYYCSITVLTVNYAKPVITREPVSQKALRFGNISMVCEAASSSDSMLTVTWKKDNQVYMYISCCGACGMSGGI